jgi:hypothetical protein
MTPTSHAAQAQHCRECDLVVRHPCGSKDCGAHVAAQAGIDLDSLPRYDHRGALLIPDQSGDYIFIDDVRQALARNAAHAAPAADERALQIHDFREDENFADIINDLHVALTDWKPGGTTQPYVAAMQKMNRYVHERMKDYARAALAQQSASPAPAAQAVDARADFVLVPVDPPLAMAKAFRDHDLNGDRFLDGYAAMLAACPAPETAQAFSNDGREPDWDGYAAAEAHAQQDAAPAGWVNRRVDNGEFGSWLHRSKFDAERHSAGNGPEAPKYEAVPVYIAPSAATGKAAAANAGEMEPVGKVYYERVNGEYHAIIDEDRVQDGDQLYLHRAGAADAKDAEPIAFPVPLKEVDVLVDGKIVSTTPVGDYFSHSGVVAYSRAAIAASQKGTEA